MKRATGRAPGKIILVGEHSVVYGHPAIAMPVQSVGAELVTELSRNGGVRIEVPDLKGDAQAGKRAVEAVKRLVDRMLGLFREDAQGLTLSVRSDIPIACGMGSSAALCVATVRAICDLFGRHLADEEIASLAFDGERIFHDSPSGIDNHVVALGKPIYFVKRKGASPIKVGPTAFRFLIADTGIASPTAEIVAEVRESHVVDRARYDALFWEMGSMSSMAREVIRARAGSRAELGMCMDRNQELLRSLGVSCDPVDRLVVAAKEAGAAGAKLTGAGRGGNVIALLGDDTDEAALSAALRAAGAKQVLEAELTPSG